MKEGDVHEAAVEVRNGLLSLEQELEMKAVDLLDKLDEWQPATLYTAVALHAILTRCTVEMLVQMGGNPADVRRAANTALAIGDAVYRRQVELREDNQP